MWQEKTSTKKENAQINDYTKNTNNIIAGTTGKETQSEILLGIEEEKKQVLLHFLHAP